uniref:Endonuclease/exonuclease/phosphatase domain-containing protein n=1 Tax=Eptatretus burgeri TaxID=7764 RepID=A0A8C4Q0S8_EPTBU
MENRGCKNSKIQVGCFYRALAVKEEEEGGVDEEFKRACGKGRVLIMVDFNLPGIEWVQEQGKGRADEDFLVFVQDCFLTQFVEKPMRRSAVLDPLLNHNPNMMEEVEVGEHLGASDCNLVCAKTLLRVRVQDSRVRLLDFRKANLKGMRSELGYADLVKLTGQSASEKWETFKDQRCGVQIKYIPMRCKTGGGKRPGWLSSEIRNTIKEKQKAFTRFNITGLELDLYHYWSKWRQVKKITWQAKREYK